MKRAYLWGWALLIVLLFLVFYTWAMRPTFYLHYYKGHDMPFSFKLLSQAITQLLNYMKGNVSTIQVHNFFNAREKAHMVDVRALYQNMRLLFLACLALCVIIPITLKRNWQILVHGLKQACYSFLLLMAYLGFMIVFDFEQFWTSFHHIFFRNQLWLLTPGVDHMIDMLPEGLFNGLAMGIAGTMSFLIVAILLVCRRLLTGRYLK